MTAPTPPPGPQRPTDDELEVVHAFLDGEATRAERARIEADPVLMAAVEEARRTRAALQAQLSVPPAGDDRRNAHVEAAMAAFGGAAAPVADLTVRRERKAWYQRVPLPAAAAAAVILAIAVIAGVSQLGSDDDGDLVAIIDADGATEAGDNGPLSAFPGEAPDESFTFDAGAEPDVDDGARLDHALPRFGLDETRVYDSVEEFVDDLEASPPSTTMSVAEPDARDEAGSAGAAGVDLLLECRDLAEDYAELPGAYQVPAEVDGEDVVAVVFAGPDGETVIHVIAVASCELLVDS